MIEILDIITIELKIIMHESTLQIKFYHMDFFLRINITFYPYIKN